MPTPGRTGPERLCNPFQASSKCLRKQRVQLVRLTHIAVHNILTSLD